MNTSIIQHDENARSVVDAETGEILYNQRKQEVWLGSGERAHIVNPMKSERKKRKTHFAKLYKHNLLDIVKKSILTKPEMALLMGLLPFLGWESNYVVDDSTKQPLNESNLAKLLHYDRKNLHSLLGSLEQKGLIFIERQGRGKPSKYLINPQIAVFGETVLDDSEFSKFNNVTYQPKSPIKR